MAPHDELDTWIVTGNEIVYETDAEGHGLAFLVVYLPHMRPR